MGLDRWPRRPKWAKNPPPPKKLSKRVCVCVCVLSYRSTTVCICLLDSLRPCKHCVMNIPWSICHIRTHRHTDTHTHTHTHTHVQAAILGGKECFWKPWFMTSCLSESWTYEHGSSSVELMQQKRQIPPPPFLKCLSGSESKKNVSVFSLSLSLSLSVSVSLWCSSSMHAILAIFVGTVVLLRWCHGGGETTTTTTLWCLNVSMPVSFETSTLFFFYLFFISNAVSL